MKAIFRMCALGAMAACVATAMAQQPLTLVTQQLDNPDNEPAPVHPVPHDRQVKWMETEFYAFFHYGMNTFTGLEWGNGDEAESTYAPTEVPDPKQWLEAVKAGGMKGGIAVVKHHDGFCLWPTETTTHSIKNAGNDNGRNANIPELFGAAARELDMKYGFYVSPWDRNSAYYGDGTDQYTSKVFLRQCAELAAYGSDQFEMWFDGANGGSGYYGGANETRTIDASTYYDVPNLRDSVHTVSPNCVLWGVGDEARWIGNEAGWAGETNWCYGSGTSGDEDATYWKAGESDAKATTGGWFWHSGESVKSATDLWKIYMETVGRNATLILNFPPDQRGKLPDADVKVLETFGKVLNVRLGNDLAPKAKVTASSTRAAGKNRTYDASNLTDGDVDTYWATNDGEIQATITFTWDEPTNVHYVALQEYIRKGQRVKEFDIEITTDGTTWQRVASAVTTTTIGYKRIIPMSGSTSTHGNGYDVLGLRINLKDGKACPLLHTVSIY